MEQTLILIKPDGVLIGLAGQIISKFEKKGFTLKGLKMITVDRLFAEKHYQDMFAKPLFRQYVNYITSGPVVAMIWEGDKVVSIGREIIEDTIPTASDMDTDTGSNLIHVSDSLESAYKQISLWFPDGHVKLLSDDAATPNTGDIGRISVMGLDTMEQTLILILPDALKSLLVGQIIRLFDRKGFTLKGLKMITVDRSFAEKHYQHMSAKPFFSDCVNYMSSGPVVAMIWEGEKVVSTGREIIEMTILCDEMDTDIGSNLFQGSDSVESANKEIALWFPDGPVELPSDAAQRDIGRISVTGFDSGVPHEDVESSLREHFASCGKITDVYIEKGRCVAYIYFVGEGAVAKALKLGSEVGEWNLCAKAYPFVDHKSTMLTVQGYNYKRPDSEIEELLLRHFSSCGTVLEVLIFKRLSVVTIKGFLAVDKALKLSGNNVGRRKVVVKCLSKPPRCTVHKRRGPVHDPRTRFQK